MSLGDWQMQEEIQREIQQQQMIAVKPKVNNVEVVEAQNYMSHVIVPLELIVNPLIAYAVTGVVSRTLIFRVPTDDININLSNVDITTLNIYNLETMEIVEACSETFKFDEITHVVFNPTYRILLGFIITKKLNKRVV